MNTEADFLAALRASPDDDLLRSAFADFLEERGDARAPLVRDDALRSWMGATYDPVAALTDAVRRGVRRIDARRACARVGGPVVAPLAELLSHADAEVRCRAARTLRDVGPAARPALPALIDRLGDADRSVRFEAAKAVRAAKPGPETDAAPIRAALESDDAAVSRIARDVLASMRAKPAAADDYAARLRAESPAERIAGVEALQALGTKSVVPRIADVLGDPAEAVRLAATRALAGLYRDHGDEAPLVRAMRDPSAAVRVAAVEPFIYSGRVSQTLLASLHALLADSSADVRRVAIHALGFKRRAAVPFVRDVERHTASANARERQAAFEALRLIAPADDALLDLFLDGLDDGDDTVRHECVAALGERSHLPERAGAPLQRFHDRERGVPNSYRHWPVFAPLSVVRPVSAWTVDVFRQALVAGDGRHHDFLQAVARLGPEAGALADVLHERIDSGEGYPYGMIVPLLATSGDSARQRLSRLLSDERTGRYVVHAVNAASPWADLVRDAASEALRSPTSSTPFAALLDLVAALGPTAEGVEALWTLAEGRCPHFPPERRPAALAALRPLGAKLEPFVPRLLAIHAGESPPSELRDVAISLLARFAGTSPAVMDLLRRELARVALLRPADSDWLVWRDRGAVLQAPVAAGVAAAQLFAEVRDLARHPDARVRISAAEALAAMRTAEAAAELCRLAAAPDDVRTHALAALARSGVTDAATLRFLAGAIVTARGAERIPYMAAVRALKTPTPELLAALEVTRGDGDRRTAVEAGRVLLALGGKKARAKRRGAT